MEDSKKIVKLETMMEQNTKEHQEINGKLGNIDGKIDGVILSVAKMPKAILEEADKKYASKTAEKIIYGMVGAIVLAVLMGVIGLVLTK